MGTLSRHIRREFCLNTYILDYISEPSPFLGRIILLSMLPAFLHGCKSAAEHELSPSQTHETRVTLAPGTSAVSNLDIFVFRDDMMRKLDCYQRFDDMEQWRGTVVSGSGKRIITVLANSPWERDDWFQMNSRSYLEGMSATLENERRENAFMSGEIRVMAGSGKPSAKERMEMIPYASEIVLNSLSCDFTGRPYAGEKIKNVRVYLTNVNAECGLFEDEDSPPRRIINAGGLDEDDIGGFSQPDLIMRNINGEIGKRAVYPDIRLWCYRSNCPDETPGTPFTRLVIEGEIEGHTYYWPININRDSPDEPGVWRNRRYSYDIKLTRKGSTDPDLPIKTEEIHINQSVTEWKEKEEYGVSF